jgi:hypothetical protein
VEHRTASVNVSANRQMHRTESAIRGVAILLGRYQSGLIESTIIRVMSKIASGAHRDPRRTGIADVGTASSHDIKRINLPSLTAEAGQRQRGCGKNLNKRHSLAFHNGWTLVQTQSQPVLFKILLLLRWGARPRRGGHHMNAVYGKDFLDAHLLARFGRFNAEPAGCKSKSRDHNPAERFCFHS